MLETIIAFVAAHAAWFVGGSLLGVLIGIVLVPALLLRIPAHYFARRHRRDSAEPRRHPVLRVVLNGTKNVLGATLVLAGIALLVLPGQGVITLLAGLMIMNYPGKFALERWLVRRPHVLPALNWLRARYGRPPLLPPAGKP